MKQLKPIAAAAVAVGLVVFTSTTVMAAYEEEIDMTGEIEPNIVTEPIPDSARGGAPALPPIPEPSEEDLAYFAERWQWANSFGNETWGGAYGIDVSVSATAAEVEETSADVMRVKGRAYADATVFGKTRNVLEVRGKAFAIEGEAFGAEIDLLVLGRTVMHEEIEGELPKTWTKTQPFFTATAYYPLGPFQLKVTASATGTAEVTVDGGVDAQGFHAEVTPGALVTVSASAAVAAGGIASVGVIGSVNIVDLDLPVKGRLTPREAGGLDWTLTADLEAELLAGTIQLFAQAFGIELRLTIADWNGFYFSQRLVDLGGRYCGTSVVCRKSALLN